MTKKIVAAVEGGGTTFRLVVGEIDDKDVSTATTALPKIIARTTVDSSQNPQTALQQCVQFLQQHRPAQGYYDGLGLATFGPVGVHPHRPDEYGCILPTTPKPIWRSVNLLQPLLQACSSDNGQQVPKVLVDTDVNAPALSEFLHYNETVARNTSSNAEKITSLAYVTVGTGVGVGLIVNGRPVHGRMHPEGGHVAIQPLDDETTDGNDNDSPPFAGYSWGPEHCPFGGKHTVEGTACSVALRERLQHRWKQSTIVPADVLSTLPDDDPLWDHAANALANLCVTLLLLVSVERIVLGGGIVMKRQHILLDKIRRRTRALLNGYLPLPDDLSQLIVTPTFGEDAGLTGAMALAARAVRTEESADKEKMDAVEKDQERETKLKQVAFGMGLWQGIIVGSLSVALLWKYVGGNRQQRRF